MASIRFLSGFPDIHVLILTTIMLKLYKKCDFIFFSISQSTATFINVLSQNTVTCFLFKNISVYSLDIIKSNYSEVKASACSVGDLGLIPGFGRSSGGEHGNPLAGRILMDRGAWGATVHGGCKELDTTERLRQGLWEVLLNLLYIICSHLRAWAAVTYWKVWPCKNQRPQLPEIYTQQGTHGCRIASRVLSRGG